ncbi:MAG: diacylglycerol kinase family protein [Gemmatimonadales bacterium]
MSLSDEAIAVILNVSAGAIASEAEVRAVEQRFEEAGARAQVFPARSGAELTSATARAIAAGARVVVAAGGDGTVNGVVSAMQGHDLTLGVLPMGTLNHFAKDLGIPLDLDQAVAVIVAGHRDRVDLAEVNGKVVLNNSSLGLYPRIVELRRKFPAHGARKWAIAAWATFRVLRHNPMLGLRLVVDGEPVLRRTALVMIGNNPYRMTGLDAGGRDSLATGELGVYVVQARGRSRLLKLVWRMLAKSDLTGQLEMVRAESVTIEARHRRVKVAIDGEVMVLEAPLEYRTRPLALEVLVPATGSAG